MVRGPFSSPGWDDPVWSGRHLLVLGATGLVCLLLVWGATGSGPGAATAGEAGSGGSDVVPGPAGRHFVVLTGGGDTAYLAIGTTSMSVPPGTLVTFDPAGLRTSLDGACPRWSLMARFGGRTVGDTRVVAGSWAPGGTDLQGGASYLVVRPEPMTWSVACYDDEGGPMALPSFTVHIEFLTAMPFS
ncbi:MAG TPA: hypothetical protein VFI44_11525 [Ornithinibacter sp.]|nr:hypothetical protein [Ornithinibacter sp.]